VAGKIHQVLKEQLDGKLSGQMYPNNQIVWTGTLKTDDPDDSSKDPSRLWFLCQMVHQHGRHFKVKLIYFQGKNSLPTKKRM
jgi:hypothetical protein